MAVVAPFKQGRGKPSVVARIKASVSRDRLVNPLVLASVFVQMLVAEVLVTTTKLAMLQVVKIAPIVQTVFVKMVTSVRVAFAGVFLVVTVLVSAVSSKTVALAQKIASVGAEKFAMMVAVC